jgi:hypothetical protein
MYHFGSVEAILYAPSKNRSTLSTLRVKEAGVCFNFQELINNASAFIKRLEKLQCKITMIRCYTLILYRYSYYH